MNADRVVTLGLLLAAVVAIGVSATTLESSLSSEPDEVIDVEYEDLPIGQDFARNAREEAEANGDGTDQRSDQQQSASGQSGGSDGGGAGASGASAGAASDDSEERSLLDRLLALLSALLPVALALAAILALVALGRRYGDRLLAVARAFLPDDDAESTASGADRVPTPRNDVERAWLSMLERAGVSHPRRMTPAECASAAVDAGLDPEGVDRLRTTFERVRYGGRDATDEERRRARESLRRMGIGPGGDDPVGPVARGGRR
jgi:hypothetical protein